ncbi:MAG: phosphotransferase [Bacilli bacterium]|nr:phosphotransferase [Bacilli bacterium]
MRIPAEILAITKNIPYTIDNIGRSDDLVLVFEKQYVLKISNSSTRLSKEKQAVDWLEGKIPGSKSLCYLEKDGKYYYLRTCIVGDSLISERFIKNPQLLIEVLEKVINTLKSLDNYQCPFKSMDNTGLDFVHGDLCLPNIFVNEQNEFIGFIDLENSGKGDRWYDYVWLLWSVWYNLKTLKYHQALIDKLGIVYDYQKIAEYLPLEYRENLEI